MTDRERVTREDYETKAINQHARLQDILRGMRITAFDCLLSEAGYTEGLSRMLHEIRECPEPSK